MRVPLTMRPSTLKPLILLLLGVTLLGASLTTTQSAHAQNAVEVAASVQRFYDQTTTLEADFYQTQFTRVYNRTTKARGHVIFSKPGRMRWDYSDPKGQVLTTTGKKLKLYEPPDEGEAKGQLVERNIEEGQLPGVFGFLTGGASLEKDFRLRLVPTRAGSLPDNVRLLELRPKKSSPHFEKLFFYVRLIKKGAAIAGVVRRILIVDAQGNRNQFDLRRVKFPRNIPTTRFEFTVPKGTHVITN